MVTIERIKDICDELNGNCGACPFASKDGCPFLSDDPMNWDVDYINKRYVNSPFNKVENETVLQQPHAVKVEDSHIPEAGTSVQHDMQQNNGAGAEATLPPNCDECVGRCGFRHYPVRDGSCFT